MLWVNRVLCAAVFGSLLVVNSDQKSSTDDLSILFDDEMSEDWVDPTDMINYNSDTQTMQKQNKMDVNNIQSQLRDCQRKLQIAREQTSPASHETSMLLDEHKSLLIDSEKCHNELNSVKNTLNQCKKDKQEHECPTVPFDNVYMKQFVRVFLARLGSSQMEDEDNFYDLTIRLNKADAQILRFYANDMEHGNIQDAHSVLANMIQKVKQLADPTTGITLQQLWWDEVSYWILIGLQVSGIFASVSVALFVFVRLHLPWTRIFARLLVLFFIISIPWNWWHMYMGVVAERHSAALKDLPDKCIGAGESSWWDTLTSPFKIDVDECAEYHRSLLVDPMWEVPPTKAVAVTFTKFALEPFEHIGEAIRKFLLATLRGVPFQYIPFFFVFVVVLVFFVVIVSSGYSIRLGYLFGLEPSKPRAAIDGSTEKRLCNIISQLDKIKDQIDANNLPQITHETIGKQALQSSDYRRDKKHGDVHHVSAMISAAEPHHRQYSAVEDVEIVHVSCLERESGTSSPTHGSSELAGGSTDCEDDGSYIGAGDTHHACSPKPGGAPVSKVTTN